MEDDLNVVLNDTAKATTDALKESLGDDFEALIIIFPSSEYLATTFGDIPSGLHSSSDENHSRHMLATIYEALGIGVEDEPESRIILPKGIVH
jgi:hypothetical protein